MHFDIQPVWVVLTCDADLKIDCKFVVLNSKSLSYHFSAFVK